MSYVIQHFYQPARDITPNPRLKLFLNCKNISKLFIFFKFNLLMINLNFFLMSLCANHLFMYQSYFLKNTDSFDSAFVLRLSANHTIKFHKSLSLYGLRNTLAFFINLQYQVLELPLEIYWFYNYHYLTIKIIKFPIFKKFYKNVFLFFLLSNIFFWIAYSNKIFFYNMSFFVFFYLKTYKFYNQKFFKIFNV